jgi:dethiobiotin synthetase
MSLEPCLRGLVVTGTDTGVGKTHLAAMILRQLRDEGLRVGAYKPVCSGAVQMATGEWAWEDVTRLCEAISDTHGVQPVGFGLDDVCPQRFIAPLAPPIAARREGRAVDAQRLVSGVEAWRDRVDAVVIEGVGGWLCPVTEDATFADVAAAWNVPVLIVARRGLGTINHTLLTIESIRARQVPIAGVILSEAIPVGDDPSVADNAAEIERRSGVPVLGEIPHGSTGELLSAGKSVRIRWREVLGQLSVVSCGRCNQPPSTDN